MDYNAANGITKLNPSLRAKFENYRSNPNLNACECFNFDEFVEIFSKTTFQWMFYYKEMCFGFTNFGDLLVHNMSCEFFNESNDEENQLFESPKKLFEMVKIDNKPLKEIWCQLYDCKSN